MLRSIRKMNFSSLLFILPVILVLVGLILYPVLVSIGYSFTNKHLIRPDLDFVGLSNYISVLTDSAFYDSLFFSLKWTVFSMLGQLLVGTIMALCLDAIELGKDLYRVLLIIPWAFPAIVIALVWKYLLNGVYGFIPNLLVETGVTETAIQFLSDPNLVFPTILFINIWFGAPLIMVNVLAALQTIPQEQYEAAKIDGANSWQVFWSITVPHIRNVIGLLVTLRTIWIFTNFDIVYLLTGGGPANTTRTLPIFAYNTGFGTMQLGRAAVISILMMLLLVIGSSIFLKYLNKREND